MNTFKKVSISAGNTKMGAIPSVSLPPVTTCPAGCPCAKKCYALKLCKLRKTVREAYENNLSAYNESPDSYFLQVKAAAITTRFFRYHVSGDIPDFTYFEKMIELANELPNTQFLAFTKKYNIVNDYILNGGEIPDNLKIIFSKWGDEWKPGNPYGLPVAEVIFRGQEPRDNWKICGGNCAECACRGVGCWELKAGETIAFYEH